MDEPELEGPKGFRSRCLVDRAGANQALTAAGVPEPIIFTTERYDTLDEFTPGAGASYFQPRRAGWYLIIGCGCWATLLPPLTVFELQLRTVAGVAYRSAQYEGHGSLIRQIDVSTIQHLDTADQVQAWVMCAVNPCALDGNRYRTNFQVHRLS